MKNYFGFFATVILILCSVQIAIGKCTKDENEDRNKISSWFKKHCISIRKTFDGSKNESKPASIFWVNDATSKDEDHYFIDLAIKIKEWELLGNSQSSFLVYPVVEWHRSTKESKPLDKISAATRLEFRPMEPTVYNVDGTPLDPLYPGQKTSRVVPFFVGSLTYGRDLKLDKDDLKASLLVSASSTKPWYPGADLRKRNLKYLGRYYPYLGFEYYELVSDSLDIKVSFGVARLYAELWAITDLEFQYLQLIVDYAYRMQLGGPEFPQDHIDLLSISVNLYLDGRGKIGLGYEYIVGEDPRKGFTFLKQSMIGLRIKF